MRRMFLFVLPALVLLIPMGAAAASAPVLVFSGDSGNYGTIAPGTTASQTFKLTNSGGVATASLKVSITGPGAAAFTKTIDGCSATSLGPKKFCSITVTYTPTSAGASDNATLTAMSKKPDASQSLALKGNGTPPNRAPVAVNDLFTTNEDTPISIGANQLLSNDTDPDGDTLSVLSVQNATHGSVAIIVPIIFTPDSNYNGSASFMYTISDGHGHSATATVHITVVPVNDPPLAANDAFTTNEDTPLNSSSVLANDSDPDGTVLSVAQVNGSAANVGTQITLASGALLTVNANGTCSYHPNGAFELLHGGQEAHDDFTYAATDGQGGLTTATVNVTVAGVNDAPVAVNDSYNVVAGETLTVPAPGVLANDTDAEHDPLNVLSKFGPDPHGVLSLNPDGSFVYTPDAGFNGTDTFFYTADDGHFGQSNTGTITINVIAPPSNHDPVANDDEANLDEDTPLTIPVSDLLANDTDVDGDTITLTSVTSGAAGTAVLLNGAITYTPDPDYHGGDTLTYFISDGEGGFAFAHVKIFVNPVNDAPVAVDDNYNVATGNTLTVPASLGVLANDTDVDGDAWDVTFMFPQNGTLKPSADGSFEYTPNAGFTGSDSFTYSIRDPGGLASLATVMINVTAASFKVSFNLSGSGEMSFATLSNLADQQEDCRDVTSLPTCSTFLASGSPARVDLVSGNNRLDIPGRPFHYTCPGGSPQPAELFQASPGANINYTGRCETESLSGDFAVTASFDPH